jgi:FixJ family two-component response regulator
MNVVPFDSPDDFLQQCDPTAHGCILLDIAMPGLNGLDLQRSLVNRGSTLPIVFLTGRGDIPTSVSAMKLGAIDFLTKPVNADKLLPAIHTAIARDRAAQSARGLAIEIQRRIATLTPREYEVFQHVISGRLNKETAAELGTAEKTIKVHRARVMEKLQVKSLAELVRLAERAGIAAFHSTAQ